MSVVHRQANDHKIREPAPIVGVDGQPGSTGGEPAVQSRTPLHRGTRIVAAGLTNMLQVLRGRHLPRLHQLPPLAAEY